MVVTSILVLSSFATLRCSRPTGEKSYIRIQAPSNETLQKSGQYTSSAFTLPTNRKLCYGVNVTGPDIPLQNNPCTPPLGLVAGFIQAGEVLEVEVPRGTGRKIDLYLHALPPDFEGACPKVNSSLSGIAVEATFLVGSVSNLDLSQESQTVAIDVSFPGLKSHIGKQANLPISCLSDKSVNKVGFNINTGSGHSSAVINGQSIKLKARFGQPHLGQMATGANIKLNGTVFKEY